MFDELLEIVKEFFRRLFSLRLFALSVMFTVMFTGLLGKLFQIQTLDGNEHQETYIQRTEKGAITPGSGGNIYDRSGNRLVYNELAYSVTIQDLGNYPRPSSRNQILYRLVWILDRRGETVEGKFEIALDQNGEMFFTSNSDLARTHFLPNFYGLSSTTSLNDPKGRYPTNITAREAFKCKRVDYELDKTKDEKGNPLVIPDSIALGMINVIYTMELTEYQKYETITVATNTSNETMVKVDEDIADLKGVVAEQPYARKYESSIYSAPIIDYTGKVQEDQLSALNGQWHQSDEVASLPENAPGKYDLNNIVGHIGTEKFMELEPQGEKGHSGMYVDDTGRPREVIEKTDAKAGDDVYLAIDKDLRIATYELIEQQLVGIISYHLQCDDLDPDKTYDPSKTSIPIEDTYYQLINNNMLSLMDIPQGGASDIEKQVCNRYRTSRGQVFGAIHNELLSPHALAMNDLPKDVVTYMSYIYAYLSDGSVGTIQKDKIDQSSPKYQTRRNGTVSLRDYTYSGIAGSWVGIIRLDMTSKYPDVDDIFIQLVDHVIESLHSDNKFTERVFRYLINSGVVIGRELCLALYTQGALAYDAQTIAAFQIGDSTCTHQLIKEKTSNLEPTLAQLALDLCMAGVVVTDVKTGEVRVPVTYPNYDNSLVSGSAGAACFNQLQDDMSRPLYNNATQAQKTPGSTLKPITVMVALGEGVIGLQNITECTGIYNQIPKPIKYQIWPEHHSSENIEEGIQDPCNYFFVEPTRRLCMKPGGTYPPDQGLATLRKYATLFGLDYTSGVEIPENEPRVSSEDPECSAMGQDTHSCTNIQLSRYMAVLINYENVFELSLLDKLTDSDGSLVKDYAPIISSYVDAVDDTWDAAQTGMYRVITDSSAKSIFSDLPVEVAGKIGTAQEDKNRSNRAFFVSFAPYSHSEIAVTVNIPYGYVGTNTTTLGKKTYEYYHKRTTLEQIESSGVLGVSDVSISD